MKLFGRKDMSKVKLDRSEISNIITSCSNNKQQARVRDLIFVLLQDMIKDEELIYKTLFNDNRFLEYKNTNKDLLKSIKDKLEENFYPKARVYTSEDTISFDENKAEMIKLIKETQESERNGEISKEFSLKTQADLRTKINDKFKVGDEGQSNIIIVPKKCNMICDKFGVECYLPTKEDLIKEYGLIEK